MKEAYRLILLVKVVYVSVQDLNEELDRYCCVHACICYAEGTLQAFEDAFAISVELRKRQQDILHIDNEIIHSSSPPLPWQVSQQPTTDD